jgi:hypothetical protein
MCRFESGLGYQPENIQVFALKIDRYGGVSWGNFAKVPPFSFRSCSALSLIPVALVLRLATQSPLICLAAGFLDRLECAMARHGLDLSA